ncbi:MAG: hypothetical protein M3O30_10740 [Planctomycetota bacterium]|nr:hypothetical protein [Planctomycetota bacterium]
MGEADKPVVLDYQSAPKRPDRGRERGEIPRDLAIFEMVLLLVFTVLNCSLPSDSRGLPIIASFVMEIPVWICALISLNMSRGDPPTAKDQMANAFSAVKVAGIGLAIATLLSLIMLWRT